MSTILLAIFLLLHGLGLLGLVSVPSAIMGLIALGAGLFMLVPLVRVGLRANGR